MEHGQRPVQTALAVLAQISFIENKQDKGKKTLEKEATGLSQFAEVE